MLPLAVCAPAPVTRRPGTESRNALCWLAFPSAPALGSTGSDPDRSASFVGFPATMAWPELLLPVHRRLRLLAFPTRSGGASAPDGQVISRFPREELEHMPGS